jgi:N-acetylneuraminic acid mutarotase
VESCPSRRATSPPGDVAAGVIDGELLLVGADASGTLVLDLLQLGLPGGDWHEHAPRPFVGAAHSAAVLDDKLYVVGGAGNGSEGRLQIYDPDDDSWTLGPDLPWPGSHVGTAVIDGALYAAGGLSGGSVTDQAAVYEPSSESWTPLPPLPIAVHDAACGTDGSRLFVIGGADDPQGPPQPHDDVQVFDPVVGLWDSDKLPGSTLSPLPAARGGTGPAVLWQGELYVFGGESPGGPSSPGSGPGPTADGVYDRVDVLDPAAGTWRLEASLPTAGHGHFPVLFQSRIFVAGGHVASGSAPSTRLEIFTRQ